MLRRLHPWRCDRDSQWITQRIWKRLFTYRVQSPLLSIVLGVPEFDRSPGSVTNKCSSFWLGANERAPLSCPISGYQILSQSAGRKPSPSIGRSYAAHTPAIGGWPGEQLGAPTWVLCCAIPASVSSPCARRGPRTGGSRTARCTLR